MRRKSSFLISMAVMRVCFLCMSGTLSAGQDVTVTAHPGNDHVFRGFGVNFTTWRDPFTFNGVTRELVDSLLEVVFSPQEMGFRHLRLFAHPTRIWNSKEMDGDEHGRIYQGVFQNVKDFQPDIQYLWSPWSRENAQGDLEGYVDRMVEMAKVLKDDYGFDWTATGVFNEPQNDPDLIDDKHIAQLVLLFRSKLDSAGLNSVKIIGPECSNVLDYDPEGPKGAHSWMVDSIAANPAALAALDGWGYHSYDYGAAKWFRDKLRPHGKEIWQSESGIHGREGGEKEIHYAAQQAAIILSDINLLADYWFFFNPFTNEHYDYDSSVSFMGEALTLYKMVNRSWEGDTGPRVVSWLKTDYIRNLSRSFTPGTQMRLCTSDLQPWTRNDVDRFIYMENTNRDISGESSQICAAAGRRSDSSWVLSAVNRTGLPGIHQDTVYNSDGSVAWMKHTYAPADSFAVTFDIAELSQSGDIEFSVTRCNQADKCFDDGVVTMQNGRVTVETAATELVTLKSGGGIQITRVLSRWERQAGLGYLLSAKKTGGRWFFSVTAHGGDVRGLSQAQIFDSRGRMVCSLARSLVSGPDAVYEWDGRSRSGAPAGPGVYYVCFPEDGFSHANLAFHIID